MSQTIILSNSGSQLMLELLLGTIQGSILSSILYAIFVSPLFDLEFFLAFADDNCIPKLVANTECLIKDMPKTLSQSLSGWGTLDYWSTKQNGNLLVLQTRV
jgi:hypothetical protein